VKKDGTKVQFPISPSNLLLVDLNLDDKKRKRKLTGKTEKVDVPVKEEKAVAQEKPVAGETNEKSS
jgi:hypothetical protein